MKEKIGIYAIIALTGLAFIGLGILGINGHYRIETQRSATMANHALYRGCIKTAFPSLRPLIFGIYQDANGQKYDISGTDEAINCRLTYLAANGK